MSTAWVEHGVCEHSVGEHREGRTRQRWKHAMGETQQTEVGTCRMRVQSNQIVDVCVAGAENYSRKQMLREARKKAARRISCVSAV